MRREVEPGNALIAAMIKCRPHRVCNCAHVHVCEVVEMIAGDRWSLRTLWEAVSCSAATSLYLYLFFCYDSGDEIMIEIDCTEYDKPRVDAIYTADIFIKGRDVRVPDSGRLMTITVSDRAELSFGPRDLTAWAMSTQQTIGGVHAKIKAHLAASDQSRKDQAPATPDIGVPTVAEGFPQGDR